MVDYSSLENCRAERHRGFESLSLRQDSGTTNLKRPVVPDFFVSLSEEFGSAYGAPRRKVEQQNKPFGERILKERAFFNIYGLSKSNIFSFFADWESYI